MRQFEYYTFVLLAFMMLVSCNSREQYREQKMKESEGKVDSSTEEVEELEELLTLTQDEKQIPIKVNDLAFDLFRYVRGSQQEKSFVVSPLSLAYIIGMTANGASGKTLHQHEAVIGRNDIANSFFHKYARSLPKRKTDMIELLNVLASNKQYTLRKEFVDSLTNIYQAGALNVNFEDANAVNNTINDWLQQHAHGKVPTISIESQPLDLIYLINYLYFRALWKCSFDEEETQISEFRSASNKVVSVPLMNCQDIFLYKENSRFQALALRYTNNHYWMLIVLPKKQTISNFIAGFKRADWETLLDEMYNRHVNVYIPKFSTENQLDLLNFMKRKIPSAVDNQADFSRMCSLPSYLSKVRQIVRIDVTESGTVAIARTEEVLLTLSDEPEAQFVDFRADHPFLYFIYDDISRTILFMGQYCGN